MKTGKLQRLISMPFYDKLNFFQFWYYRLKGLLFYKFVFKSFGRGSVIFPPMLIGNPRFITIGDRVIIRDGVRLEAVLLDPDNPPEIVIGNDVNIEQGVHIVAIGKIYIRSNVSLTARTSLLGGTHPFLDIHDPTKIGDRIAGADSLMEIGEGSFLGIGCVLQMNTRLGKYNVVGSNSVVKGSFPDYCILDGNPAVPVLQYDAAVERWTRVAKK